MSKLTHDASAFAKRVLMGAADLWVIVEGRDHDRPHYERLTGAIPATEALRVSIRLAEQIDLDGVAAGGKDHALSLHAHWRDSGELRQSNRAGDRMIVLMLDRDRDDFAGSMTLSPHVMYTVGVDVEGDILNHGDIWRATKSAYGVADDACGAIRSVVADPRDALLALWDDWIRLGLLAVTCDARHLARFEQHSTVNHGNWGPVDLDEVQRVRSSICADLPSEAEAFEIARVASHVEDVGRHLLKGRWIARYIWQLVRVHLDGEIVRTNVQADVLIDTAMETLDYAGPWTRDYNDRFQALIAA